MKETLQTRRKFLKKAGYISVGFSILGSCTGEAEQPMAPRTSYDGDLPGSLNRAPKLNAWLEILEDGRIRIFSGKVELGQGIRTAIRQVAAEELDMDLERVEVHLAETGVTPDEGYTAGSASVKNSAMSVRYAAATARRELMKLAADKLDEPIESLLISNGRIQSPKTGKSMTFYNLLNGVQMDTEVSTPVPVKRKEAYKYVGKAIPRMDIKEMVSGEPYYIQDLRFPGMLHARIVRPPNYQSKLTSLDESQLEAIVPGIIKTLVNGNFIGVIAKREYQAIAAESYLKTQSQWTIPVIFPEMRDLFRHIREIADPPRLIRDDGKVQETFENSGSFKATYTKPYVKHGSIGPACAIALYDGDILHIWSHSQGIYPLREALAGMLQLDKREIHIVGVPGAGCFGHSTADDAAADASLLAMAYPGVHVRLQWSRSDEHLWDPYGSAIIAEMEASLDETGKIIAWKSDIWTDSHSTRPNSDAGTVLAARHLKSPITMQSRGFLAGGHRNGDPYYTIPNLQLNAHYFDGPLRVSSLRSLGSFANIFAIESFMDELAERAGKDPLDFRMKHLEDERAIEVIRRVREMTADQKMNEKMGIGYAFSRYKNSDAYTAVAAVIEVDTSNGQLTLIKMWAAIDVGEVINPDGIKNQTEGGMIQAASWTLNEEVKFEDIGITSTDWWTYPVFRFADIPEVEVAVVERPDLPALGGGEAALPPTGAAIANAVYNACGKRIYNLPITSDKIADLSTTTTG